MQTERDRIVSALIRFNEKESKKKYHNPYALGLYLQALERADADIVAGKTWREALLGQFNDRLLSAVLKAVGERIATKEEKRAGDRQFFQSVGL